MSKAITSEPLPTPTTAPGHDRGANGHADSDCACAPSPSDGHPRSNEADRRLSDFAVASSDWFWEMDEDLRFSWFSVTTTTRCWLSSVGMIGRRRTDFARIDDDPENWRRHLDDLAARRPFRDFCYRVRTRCDEEVYFRVSGVPIFDAAGRFRGYRGVGSDVTDHVVAERRANAAQQQLADAIESFPGGFALFDANDGLAICNTTFRRLCGDGITGPTQGASFEEILRRLVALGRIHPEGGDNGGWIGAWIAERRTGNTIRTFQTSDGDWTEAQDYKTGDGGRILIFIDVSGQRLAAEALRKSQASLANAQRIAGVGHWEIRVPTTEMWWSDEVFRLLGHAPQAFTPTFEQFIDAVHPGDRSRVDEAIHRALYRGSPYRLEHRIIRADGSERFVEAEGEVSFDADEVPVLMTATICDRTDSRLAERALRDAENRFRFAFETCPDAVSLSRLRDRVHVDVNPAFTEIVGYGRAETLGRSGDELELWPEQGRREESIQQLCRNGAFRNLEVPFRRKDGEIRIALMSASLCMIGGEAHFFTYLRDITDLRRAEAELQTLSHAVEQSSVAMVITDPAGEIQYVNEMFTTLTGHTRDGVVGQTPRLLNSGFTPRDVYSDLWATITAGANWRGEMLNRRKDGQLYWANALISPVRDAEGRIRNFVGVQVDITDQKLAERELRESEERFRAMAESSLIGLAIERDDRAVFVNQTFAAIFGFAAPDEIMALPSLSSLFVAEDWAVLRRSLEAEALPGTVVDREAYRHHEYRGRRRDGQLIWLHTQTRTIPWNGGGPARQLIVVDVTLRKSYEEQLSRQANFDAVTALPNRSLAFDRLRTAIAGARRHQRKVGVLFIDVDHFKKINDALGHGAGDRFLRQLALRLISCVREEETVGRLGGDEFLIILPQVSGSADVERIARRILDAVAQPFVLEGQELFVSISLGICLFPDDGDEADVLLRHADAAMYQAKEQGRGTVRFFTSELNERMRERIRIEAAMRRAIDRNEFTLDFQPLIDLSTFDVVGAEALLRWNSEALGAIPPDRFIPVAEDTGLIVELGSWALQTACRQLALWHAAGFSGIRLCVNVSSRQFRRSNLVETVRDALTRHALKPEALELEITESLLMEDVAEVEATLRRLESCGVRLAVDDFGTGYSSLSYLGRFPLDTLKIDRSFTAGISTEGTQAPLIEAMIVMAHRLSLDVIAEGVETIEQLNFLLAQGCDIAQGYYFSRPISAEAFLKFLADWPTRRGGLTKQFAVGDITPRRRLSGSNRRGAR